MTDRQSNLSGEDSLIARYFRPLATDPGAFGLLDDAWLKPFARGLGEDAARFGCPLLGGDTVSTPGPLMISITAFGRVPKGQMVHRSGAKPGDRVVVTGTIGDAALGLDILRGGAAAAVLADDAAARETLVGRYRLPQPRAALAGA